MWTVLAKKDTMGLDLVLIILLSFGSLSNGQFTERPQNLVAVRDTKISFTCETGVTPSQVTMIWQRSNGVVNFETIAFNGVVNEPGYERYSVVYVGRTGTGTTRSELTLTGVLPTDAGTIRCDTSGSQAYAQLVVFESDPQVEDNTTMGMDQVIEGEYIGLSCFVPYYSAIQWAPTIIWRERTIGNLPVINQTTENEARFVYASTTHRDHDGRQFECAADFQDIPVENIPVAIRGDHNMVPPTYSFASSPLILTVNYPVENLVLNDPKDSYYPGESLKITAHGRPGPSFSWLNLLDNTTVNGSILSVTANMEGVQSWRYRAFNIIRGQRYEITQSHNFTVTEQAKCGKFIGCPRNIATVRDGVIQFSCETDITPGALNMIWQRSSDVSDFELIAFENLVQPGFERYSVVYEGRTSSDTSKSVLTLIGVLPGDAGTFQCSTVFGEVYAQLIVLGSEPKVVGNATMSQVIEGESIGLSCFVGYNSAIKWAPTITWHERTIGNLPVTDQSTANEARFVYASATHRDHNGRQFECAAEFGNIPEDNIPAYMRDVHDKVPPIYSFISNTFDLTVYYPVEDLMLIDPKDSYYPGESLTITAHGRPGPTFTWLNLSDNTTVIGNILAVTTEMKGMQSFRYRAYNVIRGQTYEIVKSHNFTVNGIWTHGFRQWIKFRRFEN